MVEQTIKTEHTQEKINKLTYEEQEKLIKSLKIKYNLRYGILFSTGVLLRIDSYDELRRDLQLRSSYSTSHCYAKVMLVIQ